MINKVPNIFDQGFIIAIFVLKRKYKAYLQEICVEKFYRALRVTKDIKDSCL